MEQKKELGNTAQLSTNSQVAAQGEQAIRAEIAKFSSNPIDISAAHLAYLRSLEQQALLRNDMMVVLSSKNFSSIVNFGVLELLAENNCDVYLGSLFRKFQKLGKTLSQQLIPGLAARAFRKGCMETIDALLNFNPNLCDYSYVQKRDNPNEFIKGIHQLNHALVGRSRTCLALFRVLLQSLPAMQIFLRRNDDEASANLHELCDTLANLITVSSQEHGENLRNEDIMTPSETLDYFLESLGPLVRGDFLEMLLSLRPDLTNDPLALSWRAENSVLRCWLLFAKEPHERSRVMAAAFLHEDTPALLMLLRANVLKEGEQLRFLWLAAKRYEVEAIGALLQSNPLFANSVNAEGEALLDFVFKRRETAYPLNSEMKARGDSCIMLLVSSGAKVSSSRVTTCEDVVLAGVLKMAFELQQANARLNNAAKVFGSLPAFDSYLSERMASRQTAFFAPSSTTGAMAAAASSSPPAGVPISIVLGDPPPDESQHFAKK